MNASTDAILLLTSHFSRAGSAGDARPLTPLEWGRFAFWLREQGCSPSDLLHGNLAESLAGWNDQKVTLARIKALLGRGHAMALAMEKWSRAGIWILTRSDAAYPRLLKHHLKASAPAVLYGCGNQNLLGAAGIAVVGSRNAGEQDLADAHALGRKIAFGGYAVVSGGARGVDEVAMVGALDQGGTAIGVLADSLLQAATARKWRDGLLSGDLVLASPYQPEAPFNAGNAMGRNKYVYCLSKAAIVVHSGSKGGTWAGAEENLKKTWVPLWIKPTQDPTAGNKQLVKGGASWLPGSIDSIEIAALHDVIHQTTEGVKPAAVSGSFVAEELALPFERVGSEEPRIEDSEQDCSAGSDVGSVGLRTGVSVEPAQMARELTFYEFFLRKLDLNEQDFTVAALAESWSLPRKLVNEWVAKAVEDGVVVQSGKKPVKYRPARSDLIN